MDFVVCDKGKAIEFIQVAYEIDSPKTYERETSSLVDHLYPAAIHFVRL